VATTTASKEAGTLEPELTTLGIGVGAGGITITLLGLPEPGLNEVGPVEVDDWLVGPVDDEDWVVGTVVVDCVSGIGTTRGACEEETDTSEDGEGSEMKVADGIGLIGLSLGVGVNEFSAGALVGEDSGTPAVKGDRGRDGEFPGGEGTG